jgi:shikimate dehydrogenase
MRSLADAGVDPAGLRCCVLGAGGAARAVVLALAAAGAGEVTVVNRTEANAVRAVELAGAVGRVANGAAVAGAIGGAHLVVNATSVGMGGGAGPIDVDLLGAGQVVADLVYEPVRTALLEAPRPPVAGPSTGSGCSCTRQRSPSRPGPVRRRRWRRCAARSPRTDAIRTFPSLLEIQGVPADTPCVRAWK